MATLPTPEEKGRMVLKVFEHFCIRPGEALKPQIFVSTTVNDLSIRPDDLANGLEFGMEQGWFDEGPNGTIRLTDAGFAEI